MADARVYAGRPGTPPAGAAYDAHLASARQVCHLMTLTAQATGLSPYVALEAMAEFAGMLLGHLHQLEAADAGMEALPADRAGDNVARFLRVFVAAVQEHERCGGSTAAWPVDEPPGVH